MPTSEEPKSPAAPKARVKQPPVTSFAELNLRLLQLRQAAKPSGRVKRQLDLVLNAKISVFAEQQSQLIELFSSDPQDTPEFLLQIATRYADIKQPKSLLTKLANWVKRETRSRLAAELGTVDSLLTACGAGAQSDVISWLQQTDAATPGSTPAVPLNQRAQLFFTLALLTREDEIIQNASAAVVLALVPKLNDPRKRAAATKEAHGIVAKMFLGKDPRAEAQRLGHLAKAGLQANQQLQKQIHELKQDLQQARSENAQLGQYNRAASSRLTELQGQLHSLQAQATELEVQKGELLQRTSGDQAFHKRQLSDQKDALLDKLGKGLGHQIQGIRITLGRVPADAAVLIEQRLSNIERLAGELGGAR